MQPPWVPVGGTPIIPPAYLTVYFGLFVVLLCGVYLYFYRKKRPTLLWHKIRLLLVIAFIIKATVISGGGLLAAYWLIPAPNVRRVSTSDRIEIVFDRPLSRGNLEKSISPETPGVWVFENSLYTTHLYRKLVFYPSYSLRPNTTYTIKLTSIRNLLNVSRPYEYQFDFTTSSPKIAAVDVDTAGTIADGPSDISVVPTAIKVTLDSPNDHVSEFEFLFTPRLEYDTTLDTTHTIYTLTPSGLAPATDYKLKIIKSDIILNLEDGTVVERGVPSLEYDGSFTTTGDKHSSTGPAQVAIVPSNNWQAVNVHSPISMIFDRPVDHTSTQQKFSIVPEVKGAFSWEGDTLTFVPSQPLAYTTLYTVALAGEVKGEFSTQNATTKLAVPAYLQKYTLSCEIASLRMALNYRGANVTEDQLIPIVGLDTIPHIGNTWGNPYSAFVGNIKGTQMKDGYGVHWGPIARAARNYRNASEFVGWSISELTAVLANNNPVIIWVYSHAGRPTSWKTPDGTNIYAVRDEHAVVAVGFVGPPNNPTQIIINDPLIGQVYWSRASFDKKWAIFGRSGVVVY